jgi:hypothetical protein
MNQTPSLSSEASLHWEKFIDDLSIIFDDLLETDRFCQAIDSWISILKENSLKVNWIRDVLPSLDPMRYHVIKSLARAHKLEQEVYRVTSGSSGPGQFLPVIQLCLRAERRHHQLLNRLLTANQQFLEERARHCFWADKTGAAASCRLEPRGCLGITNMRYSHG